MSAECILRYPCTNCQEDIASVRVVCIECPAFELCLECFSRGAEIGSHKKYHAYKLIDSAVCDLYQNEDSNWSGRETLLMLNSLERNIYGNWDYIGEYIGTRTAEEVENEYNMRFLNGEIGPFTWVPGLRNRWRLKDFTKGLEDDPIAADTLPHGPPNLDKPYCVREKHALLLDYMPLRDTFTTEYENEAETLISHLTWSPDDDIDMEIDIALKSTLVEMYTQRLRERAKCHQILKDNHLIQHFFDNNKSKKKSREDKECRDKLRSLCKLQEQTVLTEVLQLHHTTRKLSELMRYRRNGIVSREQISQFEQERQLKHNIKLGIISNTSQNSPGGSKKKEVISEINDLIPLDPTAGAHLLSANETKLCKSMDMTPSQFISLKTLMLMEPDVKLEGEVPKRMLNHLVNSGWLPKEVIHGE